jgi:hypothetical protein
VIIQDPDSAESGVGPRAVFARTAVDAVLKLEEIAGALAALCPPALRCGGM